MATSKGFRSNRWSSISSKSVPVAAPLPGSTRRSVCMSGRKAQARHPARCVTAAAALSRRSPTPNLVLGRLNPANFLGGRDAARCRARPNKAIAERIAAPFGYTGKTGMATDGRGIISIAQRGSWPARSGKFPSSMASIRVILILFSYGGGGPLGLLRFRPRVVDSDRRNTARAGKFFRHRHAVGRCAHRYLEDLCRHSQRTNHAVDDRAIRFDGNRKRPRRSPSSLAPARYSSSAMPRCVTAANATISKCRSRV